MSLPSWRGLAGASGGTDSSVRPDTWARRGPPTLLFYQQYFPREEGGEAPAGPRVRTRAEWETPPLAPASPRHNADPHPASAVSPAPPRMFPRTLRYLFPGVALVGNHCHRGSPVLSWRPRRALGSTSEPTGPHPGQPPTAPSH